MFIVLSDHNVSSSIGAIYKDFGRFRVYCSHVAPTELRRCFALVSINMTPLTGLLGTGKLLRLTNEFIGRYVFQLTLLE